MKLIMQIICTIFVAKCFYWLFGLGLAWLFSIEYKKRWDMKEHKSYVPPIKKKEKMAYSYNKTFFLCIRNFIDGYIRTLLRNIGNIHSHFVRNVFYKYVFKMNISKKVVIYGGAEIRSPEKIEIGRGSIIGDEAKLDARNGIYIGDNVNLSSGVWIWTEQHDVNDCFFDLSSKKNKSVIIDDRAWLGSRTTILPGTHIGEGAVVCAGAVVTKDCEPYGIYAGIPAKKIGDRNRKLEYEFDGRHYMFY